MFELHRIVLGWHTLFSRKPPALFFYLSYLEVAEKPWKQKPFKVNRKKMNCWLFLILKEKMSIEIICWSFWDTQNHDSWGHCCFSAILLGLIETAEFCIMRLWNRWPQKENALKKTRSVKNIEERLHSQQQRSKYTTTTTMRSLNDGEKLMIMVGLVLNRRRSTQP